ncbi:inter-alpha-trypsin inhibitor heavy chain H5 [Octopus bimaculoides]|uniref:VWFA domain-containing protein n=1 Tax=Octopus bimaculoides TaxID=37653 RepID=A0A0L8FKQ0_OCTBM|nr:inter-alpha-trypsin inhibitor heavy chain H5 [Octopus bimaculoides]XP_052829118.1 inter-alpha-trypsin inhibitor heavy chain H5 [Octopus bimaculoides]|eukprot:XP_014788990.1 PREDICTED: inter-alpha-trypsin inhibitor heavy chain H5-like [Octopus bimaculoides]
MFYRFGGIHFWLLLLSTITDGLVMPRIRRMAITSDIRYRFATTHISLDVGNTQQYTEDFYFETQLPVGSLISNVSLYVNGTHYKSKTQKVSEEYKIWLQKTNLKLKLIKEDRSLYSDSNVFVMTVPMAALSKAQFNLTYNYLLHRQNNKYKFPVYLFFRQGQYVSDVVINTYLWEPTKIMEPSVKLFKEHNMPVASIEQKVSFDRKIHWISPNNIHISYKTSFDMIRNLFSRNFLLEYSLKQNPKSSGNVLWHNKEGLVFFSPRRLKPFPKDIIFTIDYTESMKGEKLSEVKKALSSILRMTSPKDRFKILLYNKNVYQGAYGLLPVNAHNIKMAFDLFKNTIPYDTSDLNLAIEESLKQLNKSDPSEKRVRVVYFLTDGWQSMNNIRRHKITKSFRKANKDCKAIFFNVALHLKADYILLKTLSNLSGGKTLRITEKQNISKSMVNFYKEMKTPLLTNLSTVGPYHNTSYYVGLKDYYKGSENILYFNKTNVNSSDGSTLYVYSDGANGAVKFKNTIKDSHIEDNIGGLNSFERKNFMAKYLDFLFIRMVIDRKLKARREEAIDKAMRNGFLTPWTYMSALPSSYNAVQNLGKKA